MALLGGAAEVAPVLIRRLEEKEVHLHRAADQAEQLQIEGRQAGDAENRDARGQTGQRGLARREERLQAVEQRGRVQPCLIGREPAPEFSLPPGIFLFLPAEQPLGRVGHVLVEDRGDLPGELETFHRAGLIVADIAAERREDRLAHDFGQEAEHAPEHGFAGEGGRGCGGLRQRGAKDAVREIGEKRELAIHRDAEPARDAEGKPAPHPEALHHDDLRLERIGQRVGEQRAEPRGQLFHAIAPVKVQAGHQRSVRRSAITARSSGKVSLPCRVWAARTIRRTNSAAVPAGGVTVSARS